MKTKIKIQTDVWAYLDGKVIKLNHDMLSKETRKATKKDVKTIINTEKNK